jgi:hypothetical protein
MQGQVMTVRPDDLRQQAGGQTEIFSVRFCAVDGQSWAMTRIASVPARG